MTRLVIYPRLYQVKTEGEGPMISSQGDDAVTALYREYEIGDKDTRGLNFRYRVFDCALRLFGDFREWMMVQRNNPNMVGYNLEFLRDTLQYIFKGTRQMSPMVWGDLVKETDDFTDQPHHLTHEDLRLPENITTAQLLQLWCSRKGGFEDLLQTLNVFFGSPRGQDR
jgi:hypothetical protein